MEKCNGPTKQRRKMPRATTKRAGGRTAGPTKYDAHHNVLSQTYGALADLRRELADSKDAVAEREEILKTFSRCKDSQRAWLLIEDYFEKLSLSRKDFAGDDWWPKLLAVSGKARLEETALLFLKAGRSLPSELMAHANFDRLAELEQEEQDQEIVQRLESWLLPKSQTHLDAPRASLNVVCSPVKAGDDSTLHRLRVDLHLFRPRTGAKIRTGAEIIDLTTRSAHERELFSTRDWEFIEWLAATYKDREELDDSVELSGLELIQWLTRWGHTDRLSLDGQDTPLQFHGQLAELEPHLVNHTIELSFTQRLSSPDGARKELGDVVFFDALPLLALVGDSFLLVRNTPPPDIIESWLSEPLLPVTKLSHGLLVHLRKTGRREGECAELWDQLCETHAAVPQFVFELADDTVRLRLNAKSENDGSLWQWNGHDWQFAGKGKRKSGKPEILDDPRLVAAAAWLRRLDWFTPEPGLWVGDANENFLNVLAAAWPERPKGADYLGNGAFQRLFLKSKPLKPKIMLKGSGIDWLSVSAKWEAESLKLTPADLKQLAGSTGRFVKLPDSGWVELDSSAVQKAHDAMADLGVDGLSADAQKIEMLHASEADEETLNQIANKAALKTLRTKLEKFEGVPKVCLPENLQAELRPYQQDGFEFLCHLTKVKMGGILADDMGLGKTLQTLTWLLWLKQNEGKRHKPTLVICPASVLHNWRREANKFTPDMKVLVLESGSARHNLRKQIPEHDIIITNYALLRRDLEALSKFEFGALVLDEAQFIKNPTAQVTQSVKQLKARRRLALTGTPLENRMLDLWSIVDFVQPGYLGTQADFTEKYEPRGDVAPWEQKTARKRLSSKLRPLLMRRLKTQVAKDLPDRIEERRDCLMQDEQRKLYLAELRRSREQVMDAVKSKGLAKSKMHVLAALTRLRQICCHPGLVGNDTHSGKTETFMELLEPLLAEGQKVLVFSQFVQMLRILEDECHKAEIPTHILTGETKNRQEVVNAFQEDDRPGVFLLSLRAAGTGLNLSTASYVVLYDPWWNPAVEAQAIDRSHRIGQKNKVIAYKLISPGTVEEKIWDLQQRKSQTIKDVLGEEGFAKSLSKTDLEYLFSED